MTELKQYKYYVTLGVDDLEGMMGDFATEWWTPEDWAKFHADTLNRDRRNQEYIDKLKAEGRFGLKEERTISFVPFDKFNDPVAGKGGFEYRMVMLDLSNQSGGKRLKLDTL